MTNLFFEKYLEGIEGIINNIKKKKTLLKKLAI